MVRHRRAGAVGVDIGLRRGGAQSGRLGRRGRALAELQRDGVANAAMDHAPALDLAGLGALEAQIDLSLRTERLVASLSALFGLLATLLAVIGLYGVMAFTVARRTREIGIRMALGAIQANVIWLVMKEVLLLVAIGVVIGVPAAIGLGRLVQSQLYGLRPYDVTTLVASTFGLAAVACLAGFLPALRASRIDPMRALHYE